ncbi:MAG TPA: (Fe-S)-binding protein [Steroidobacteraceae bacterium]|nr:(Fe-S)-binding protein [Steroidobacteraceae bacterium]
MTPADSALGEFEIRVKELEALAPPVTLSDEERVSRAKQVMLEKLDSHTAMDLETCVHCGMCAEACHFYESTQDPKYTPIHKAYLLRKVYRRELSPVRLLNKLFLREITAKQLDEWTELAFNSCTECGRCDLMCPMGIHISRAISITREALGAAGAAPAELRAVEYEQVTKDTLFGVGAKQLTQTIEELRARGLDIPLDKPTAEVMLLTTAVDLVLYKETLAATAKILNALKVSWTLQSCGFEAANFGMLSGHLRGQALESQRIIDAAIACGAKIVITPECGHAYPALRWEAANDLGKPLPFDVMAISEYVGREIRSGRLKVHPIDGPRKVTYQDPCKIGRHGGVFEEPRAALKALGVELHEMESHGKTQYCCGGGGGVFLIDAAEPLRRRTFEIKQHQVDETGADALVTTCNTCRLSLSSAGRKVNWNTPIESLVELVAANLADTP